MPDQSRNQSFAFKSLNGQSDRYQADYIDVAGMVLAPGSTISTTNRLFAGAKEVTLLDSYATEYGIRILIWRLILGGSIS